MSNNQLFQPPPKGQPFISPDLQNANVAPGKSGYLITVADNLDPTNHDVVVMSCNALGASRAMYHVAADPVTRGTLGDRSVRTSPSPSDSIRPQSDPFERADLRRPLGRARA
jgi:hypothetical protein